MRQLSVFYVILALIFYCIKPALAAVGDDCSATPCSGNNEECTTDGTQVCTCSAGYHDTDSDLACNACDAGTFKKVVGEAACTTAQQGYYTVDTIGGSTATNTAAKDEAQVPRVICG